MRGSQHLLNDHNNNPSYLLSLLEESCTSVSQALQIHSQIIVNGIHHNAFCLDRLISFFALSSSPIALNHSRLLFSLISRPHLFLWNTMIRAYSRSHHSPHQALLLYKSMSLSPNHFTFPFLINACARLSTARPGMQIHSHVIRYGFDSNVFVRNSLIHFYSFIGDLYSAHKLFYEGPHPDLVSCNTMMNGYNRGGHPANALGLFGEMQVLGLKPDDFTFVALFSACSLLNDPETGKRIHALVYKNSSFFDSNVLLKSSLVNMYAKCGFMEMANRVFCMAGVNTSTFAWSSMVSGYARSGEIEIARRLFDEMPERDAVSWTAMISGYSQTGRYSEALELFFEMEGAGLLPDEVTMVSVLSSCAQLGTLDLSGKIHQYIQKRSFDHNVILCTTIVDTYAKCGSIETALDVFCGVPEESKTVALFNAMISGLAQHGLGKKAMSVFGEMLLAGLRPDEITFVSLLCALSHSGLIEEGKTLFDSMVKDHGIKPQIEHYGCMVDLLGRGGFLKEALDFIEKMPIEVNDHVIWGSLLSACRIHGDIEMSEIVGKRLLQLDPDHGSRYVLLSNIFADANRWEDARRERKRMEERGIQKPPGLSYIELNGHLHQFLASDMSCPQSKEMSSMLNEMTRRLRSAGHVPSTVQVTFDIDEEEKENVVSYHSEKLALAFGLINSGSEMTIRIMKNLRICEDCHSSFKLLSKLFGREIIMRDRFRFHHFKSGSCSCMDYW
ncbi:pentatricopeptide repeat-containing protein At3g62890-like [Magnolia sinica]|uniref:pentatricopeptide repeat-containing protein At3g62890-like n=1 Tax=Magnolia sinica TaxID=86752 RepID=UPI00265AED1D|nr:pentatricopeptide repeat-containing protein At3g62890-like [Magnolia sinica]